MTLVKNEATPTLSKDVETQIGGYPTIVEALDAAATGAAGYNFFNLRGELTKALPFAELAANARAIADRLAAHFKRGDRIAMIAETSPEFVTAFYACQYAGLVPAPMPMPVTLGGKEGYVTQMRLMISGAEAAAAIGPKELFAFLEEATADSEDVAIYDFDSFFNLQGNGAAALPAGPDDLCYIQYSSGSTSAPKGVIGTQRSVNANLTAIARSGLFIKPGDRAVSWLPLYHDMGLIGFMLTPMVAQMSTDYIATSDFVRRPLLWLRIMTEQKTTVTYSPSFGYDLAAKRSARAEPGSIDISRLRVAGIGGDMVRPEALNAFTEAFEPCGFDKTAFTPSYGMAEATLAISFPTLNAPLTVETVDMRHLTRSSIAQPAADVTPVEHQRGFVACGRALPGHAIEVRNENGDALKDRDVGRIFIKGPSLTPGYFSDPEASGAIYHGEWLDTGDMGYVLDGQIIITGRAKDLIIINGRNIWPQDIEWAVEKADGVRGGGVAAFSFDDGGGERIVVIVEKRGGLDEDSQNALSREIASIIQSVAGAPAEVALVRPHSLVMTSSGKLSRAKVKQKYLNGDYQDEPAAPAKPALAESRA